MAATPPGVGMIRSLGQGGPEETSGTVVRLVAVVTNPDRSIADNRRRWAGCPIVRFATRAGSEHEVRGATWASPPVRWGKWCR